jgi:hypothetical protein
VAVLLGVRLVDRWRHEVVFSTRYEQQRCPAFVPEVDINILVTRREVGQGPSPHELAGSGAPNHFMVAVAALNLLSEAAELSASALAMSRFTWLGRSWCTASGCAAKTVESTPASS